MTVDVDLVCILTRGTAEDLGPHRCMKATCCATCKRRPEGVKGTFYMGRCAQEAGRDVSAQYESVDPASEIL
jgi:hypothetical protein